MNMFAEKLNWSEENSNGVTLLFGHKIEAENYAKKEIEEHRKYWTNRLLN